MDNATAGIIFGLIAMFGYGLSNSLTKIPVNKIGSLKTVFFRNVFASFFLLIALLFFLPESTFSISYILIALVLSLIGYVSIIAYYKALGIGKIGIVSPVANSSVIFTVLFSIIFFKEALSITQAFSITMMIAGILLISINFRDLKKSHIFQMSSGIPYALVTCFLWGIMYSLIKIPVMVIGPILTSFIIEAGLLLYSGVHLKVRRISFSIPDFKTTAYIFFLALFGAIATLSFNLGIKFYNVSIVAALAFSSPLIVALYGKFIYKEKLTFQQWFAIMLMLVGIVCISYF